MYPFAGTCPSRGHDLQGGGLVASERRQSSIRVVVGSIPPRALYQKGPGGSGHGAFMSIATAPLGAGKPPVVLPATRFQGTPKSKDPAGLCADKPNVDEMTNTGVEYTYDI